jgi:gliding motility-associated-like protein
VDTLVPIAGGYIMAYDRCCWNGSVSNLVLPLEHGLAIVSSIPDPGLALVNSSPYFKYLTPPFICLNQELIFDHSAIDLDGDSLVYELFNPYDNTLAGQNGGPPDPPPYYPLLFKQPYLKQSIDPQTGIFSATPDVKGQFVFGVKVKEYRNGVEIGETSRSYQLNVASCSKVTEAHFPSPIYQCGDSVVSFGNTSWGATSYEWDFGDPGSVDPGSFDPSPTHTFSSIKDYTVQLIAYSYFGNICNDTTLGQVRLFPELLGNFSWEDEKCDNFVQFSDITPISMGAITSWHWNFGDGNASEEQNPYHYFSLIEDMRTYQVWMIIENVNGCTDSVLIPYTGFDRKYSIDGVSVSKSVIYPRDDSTLITVNAQNAMSYSWNPKTGLTDTTSNAVFAKPQHSIRYKIVVTDNRGCTDEGQAAIRVYKYSCGETEVYMPNGFSPNGDGENDYLRLRGEEIARLDLSIYNRLGELVFHSTNIGMLDNETYGWDGRYKGKLQDPGVFVYYLKVSCSDDRNFIKKGNITLLR